ncbi:uncharacterized protein LOC119889991 [Micropterus salmoides]|uniref:uncharacterized protein LOC119889991 n=2 Tax=Micropterus salmoides TaxID=27706 RepID=UPI0018EDDF13|nr:uncharacterized protein LOC119889991 [Micropterus salmoides]
MAGKRSVVWVFFKTVDSESVQCLLCNSFLVRHSQGTTTAMLRHLRVKHPNEVVKKSQRRGAETASIINGHQDLETDSEQFCSVEVALEDGDSDSFTPGNEADINSAINGILEAAGPAEQITHEEASDDRPVTQKRTRSLVWRHYERLDSLDAARCRICMKKFKCFEGSSTSNLRRHISKRHPRVFSQLVADGKKAPPSRSTQGSNANGDTSAPPETRGATEKRQFSVEVALDNRDSDIFTMGNEAENNSAINGILEAAGPAEQITHEEASDDGPVRHRRNKQSLIWRHYERLDSLDAARCRICMKKLQCFQSGSTSNLHRHMSKRHPEMFSQLVADGQNPLPVTVGATEKRPFSGALTVSRVSEGEKRVLRRERELIEALRRAQREEARALEHQRELLEKLQAANAREAAAERQQIESLRKAQLEEAKDLSRQKEELKKEKAELQKKREELQQERQELLLFSSGQQAS